MPPKPIESVCDRTYRAAHSSGIRDTDAILWVVIHSTEGGTARGAAEWFANPRSSGSAHLCVDDQECYRTLRNTDIPWAAPGANITGLHIEQAGYAKWDLVLWNRHRLTLQRAAYKTALHLVAFQLPPNFVFANELRKGMPGVTTHAECTKAFGGDHTDPGRFWPRRKFMGMVRAYYGGLLV